MTRPLISSAAIAPVLMLLAAMPGAALAETADPEETPAIKPRKGHPGVGNWIADPDGMTGDWGGRRKQWADRGITPYAGALAELASNVDGGNRRRTAVATQVNAGVALDMDKLASWKGGKIRLEFAYRDGKNLSATDVGNLFEVQETFGGGRIARLAELSVEQSFAGGKASIKAGRVFAGADFAFSQLSCDFQSNAFCGHPNSIPYNSGISLYPVASWGARLEVKPVDHVYVRTGVFEVNPSLNFKHGFDWSTRKATGVIVPVEIGYTPDLGNNRPGLYRVGGYYDSSNTPDSFRDNAGGSRARSGLPALERKGRWGVYALAEQKLTSSGKGGVRGLSMLLGATLSDRATAYFDYFFEGALVQTGTFRGRDHDTVALGIAYGHVSPARARFQRDAGQPVQTAETVIELNYGIQAGPWLSFRPNIQYIIRPGATGTLPNATVLGLQTVVTF
jgi:porin